VQVSPEFLEKTFQAIEKDPATKVKIDLENQEIKLHPNGPSESFDINPYKKKCLLNGFDDIDYLLSINTEIDAWEEAHS
jgi:3-isopropylmalate/(R)-2-methylmalate dehydratase small subunit